MPTPPAKGPCGARRLRAGVVGLLAALLMTLLAGPAAAHESEKSKKAVDDVRQAIAYIANDPGKMDSIKDKVNDAIESDNASGVDIALVKKAQAGLEMGDLMTVRLLLEQSIGAEPDMTGTNMQPILKVAPGQNSVPLATGEQTGTTVVRDSLPGREDLTNTDWTLLAIAGLGLVLGLALARRWRPHDSIRQLRRRLSPQA